MKLLCLVLLVYSKIQFGMTIRFRPPIVEGAACLLNDRDDGKLSGVVKKYEDCLYTKEMVKKLIKPEPLTIDGYNSFYCCPHPSLTGPFKDNFKNTKEGKLRGSTVFCIYNGVDVTCCPNTADDTPTSNNSSGRFGPHEANIDPYEKCKEYAKSSESTEEYTAADDTLWNRTTAECRVKRIHDNVIGGTDATDMEFPHMAHLGVWDHDKHEINYIAGGSLISEYFILTAAHVISNNLQYALLGTLNYNNRAKDGIMTFIKYTKQHPHYNSSNNNYNYDIALCRLMGKITFTPSVRPICLPSASIKTYNDRPLIAGWGRIEDELLPSQLKKGQVTIRVNDSICRNEFENDWDSDTMLCVRDKNQDSCYGDSGGPLMKTINPEENPDLRCSYVIIGIVSSSKNSCGVGRPAQYTNVMHDEIYKWIVENVWI